MDYNKFSFRVRRISRAIGILKDLVYTSRYVYKDLSCAMIHVGGLCSFAPVRHLFHEIHIDKQQIMRTIMIYSSSTIYDLNHISETFFLDIFNI